MQEDKESMPKDMAPQAAKDRGMITGVVKYPWGTVGGATVAVGGKSVTADTAGKYEMPAQDPGSYEVTAQAPFPGYEAVPQKVEIAAGETKDVDVYLDFKKTIVEGHVCDRDGKPIAGATLSGVLSGSEMETMTTDERGYFRFDKVALGERFIRANAPAHVGETRDFTAREDGTTVAEFRLAPATCKVHGIVTNATGNALRAEVLLLKSEIVVQKTNSDAQTGYYEFPLQPGTYIILPTAPRYQHKQWRGSISADIKVDFSLVPIPEMPEEGYTRRRQR